MPVLKYLVCSEVHFIHHLIDEDRLIIICLLVRKTAFNGHTVVFELNDQI